MISGSPWFQHKGNHSATYNVLKAVVAQGNHVTLIYPTKKYSEELENARKIEQDTPPGLQVIPVDIHRSKLNGYYRDARRLLSKLRSQPKIEQNFRQFSDYFSTNTNLNKNFVRAIRDVLMNETFDIVQVDYPSALKTIAVLPELQIPSVFVNHEIQAIRMQRTFRPEENGYQAALQRIKDVEGTFLSQYDAVITLTAVDSEKLRELYAINAMVSPHAVDTDFWKNNQVSSGNKRLVFSGGEGHFPNRDAVDWLCSDILPALDRRLDDYQLYITGKWSEATVKQLSSSKVIFTGYVDDIRRYLSGSISLAPLRIGSGMRVKILEAMAMECIVVSTGIGCEGLGSSDGTHLFVEDNAKAFAGRVSKIYKNPDGFSKMGTAARDFVVQNYGVDATGERRVEVFEQILASSRNQKAGPSQSRRISQDQ
jgi:glycosyltransferase involved in cell wall biosynthesis